MTKKAHFIIPTVLIKESNITSAAGRFVLKSPAGRAARFFGFADDFTPTVSEMNRIGTSALPGTGSLTTNIPGISNAAELKLGTLADDAARLKATATPVKAPGKSNIGFGMFGTRSKLKIRNAPVLQQILDSAADAANPAARALASATDDAAKAVAGTADDAAKAVSPTAVQTAAAKEPNKYLEDLKGFLRTRTGRIAAPSAAAIGGLMYGRSGGYDKGFGEGTLAAQQMAAIQAMQMQQQARQMYDNQGIIDRVMGRNPF